MWWKIYNSPPLVGLHFFFLPKSVVLISESTSEDRARLTLAGHILVGGETIALGAIGSHGAQAWMLAIAVLWSEGFLKNIFLVIFKLSRRKKGNSDLSPPTLRCVCL